MTQIDVGSPRVTTGGALDSVFPIIDALKHFTTSPLMFLNPLWWREKERDMNEERCDNDVCVDPLGHGGELYMCKRCHNAVYCSKYCQTQSWNAHFAVCGLAPEARIGGMVAISTLPENQTKQQRQLVSGSRERVFLLQDGTANLINGHAGQLDAVISFLLHPSPSTSDAFFSGVKSSLLRISDLAIKAQESTMTRLDATMREWATLNGFSTNDGTNALLVRWKIERSKTSAGSDTPTDQGVVYLIQKNASLATLIATCDLHLSDPNGIRLSVDRRPTKAVEEARKAWIMALVNTLINLRDSVIGMHSVKNQIGAFVQKQLLYKTRGGFLNFGIFGNPGTGKTEIASRLSEILYRLGFAPVLSSGKFTKADFVGAYEGQTAHLTRITMLRGLGSLMFIDEAYQLMSSPYDSFGKESIAQIVNDLDEYRGMVSIALVGYEKNIRESLFGTNPGLMRRISDIWILPNYTPEELFALLIYYMTTVEGYTLPLKDSKGEQRVKDAISALHANDVFANSNAGSIASIIELYRTIYATIVFTLSNVNLEVDTVVSYGTLTTALIRYAAAAGFVLYDVPDVKQNDIPSTWSSSNASKTTSTQDTDESSTGTPPMQQKRTTAPSRRKQ